MTDEKLAARSEAWTLITVAYNSETELRNYWALSDVGDARRIVVDNASLDSSASIAEAAGAEVIRLPKNVGFARANNVALAGVSSPWVAFVNPDVVVDSPADLARLGSLSVANGKALVAPQLMSPDGSEQANARGLPYLLDKLANRGVRLPGARLEDYARTGLRCPTYVSWVMGAALAGPTVVFRDIGGWDERFFIYYEDHDIGLRAWRAGVPMVVDPSVRWLHQWQRATTKWRLGPWRRELASAIRFYQIYPEYLAVYKRRRVARTSPEGALLWEAAPTYPNRSTG